jgi:hypothetical protein
MNYAGEAIFLRKFVIASSQRFRIHLVIIGAVKAHGRSVNAGIARNHEWVRRAIIQ